MIIMNRNTSPIKPLTDRDILEVARSTDFNQYPDRERDRFISLYADHYGLDPASIELANGSDEWIQKLVVTLGQKGVMTLDPDFVMYQVYTEQFYPEILKVPADPDFNFSFDKILEAVYEAKPSLFLISNPHNPTGTMFDPADLQRLADAMANLSGYLCIDECYIDFAPDYDRPQGDNVLFLRTLSKLYGMAGLRIGLAIAKGDTYRKITRINHPYPLNSLSLNLASHFFADQAKLADFRDYQLSSKAELVRALDQVADLVKPKPSFANYVFTYGPAARSLADFVIDKGFLPRTYDSPGLEEMARYSVIKLEDYPAFKEAVAEWRQTYVD